MKLQKVVVVVVLSKKRQTALPDSTDEIRKATFK